MKMPYKAIDFNGTQVKVTVDGKSFVCEKEEFDSRPTLSDMLQTIVGLTTPDADKTAKKLQEVYDRN